MGHPPLYNSAIVTDSEDLTKSRECLRKQAWDYFQIHAAQRLSIFNFYLVISSVTLSAGVASFKVDSNLHDARPAIAGLLCLFSFIFWKLDQRTKFLVKIAEAALVRFEADDVGDPLTKIFTQELNRLPSLNGWHRLCFWRWRLSYSDCFNVMFLTFFLMGLFGLVRLAWQH